VDTPPDVTIKFFRSDLHLQAHKHALIAGSAFFADHFLRVKEPSVPQKERE